MAGEDPRHMHPGQDLLPREPGPLPEGDHAVRVHGVPAIEEDDLVAFQDGAHEEEGRQVEHEVGTAVDQGDLAASKEPRIRSRVGTEVVRAGREIARSSGTGTMAGSTTSAMESSPRFD